MDLYDDISQEELVSQLKEIDENGSTTKVDDIEFSDVSDILKSYLVEISRYPLLTKEEERKYCKNLENIDDLYIVDNKVKKGICCYSLNEEKILRYLTNSRIYKLVIDILITELSKINNANDSKLIGTLKKYNKLSAERGRRLNCKELKEYFNIDNNTVSTYSDLGFLEEIQKYIIYREAYNKMFHSNLKLVVSIAKKQHQDTDIMELISAGNLGLMKAIDRYDVNLGFKFSTYSTWWITQEIQRDVSYTGSVIRFPTNYKAGLIKFRNDVVELKKELRRDPTETEIAKALNISLDLVKLYNSHSYNYVSLSQPIGEDKDFTLEDTLENKEYVEDNLINNSLVREIGDLLDDMEDSNEITNQERIIIEMLYGIGEYRGTPKKAAQISKYVDLPVVKVKSTYSCIIRKIRRKIKENPRYLSLKDYLN